METSTSSQTDAAPQSTGGRGGRNRRRQRGNASTRGNRGGAPRGGSPSAARPSDPTLALRPASITPTSRPASAQPSGTEHPGSEQQASSFSRPQRARGAQSRNRPNYSGRGGVNVSGRGGGFQSHLTNGIRQRFGGNLTNPSESSLQAQAPIFTPGKAMQTSSRSQPQRTRRDSTLISTAPDIATRTHENIKNGLYECLICMNEVLSNSKIWSCKTCWKVFHLSCIKKWSQNEGSALAQRQTEGDMPAARQWRCPGCNLPKEDMPSTYTCWCEKEAGPRSMGGVPPHSCGQSCGKARVSPKDCPHACDQQCHAGPCQQCTYMGPEQTCFCGKNTSRKRCIETDYNTGWSCGEICGDLMPCGEHFCSRPCHEGLCGACEVMIEGRCFCGKQLTGMICNDKGVEALSEIVTDQGTEYWTGIFSCDQPCGRTFDCNKHECQQICHAQTLKTAHCPQSADVITSCPCGKTGLSELDCHRDICTDPVPSCRKECEKLLSCGHSCQRTCHTGPCPPCFRRVEITCRCGKVTTSTACHQGDADSPMCPRTCKALLNCGRHDCGERCCTGERKATERLASKRKLRPLGASGRLVDENFEPEHICTRVCGRQLKCGNHTCPELCHKGPCAACREAIFDEISCNCGRTVLSPPLPCGTAPPPCRFDCERPKQCGHPQIQHNCHGNDVECPKCPYLVEKSCMCSKKTLKNQKCWLADVRCGEICGKLLRCGSHTCRKQCHRPGECEDAGSPCQQACGKEKKSCGHPCEERCHAPSACKEEKPCQSKFLITCECQNLKTETKCLASRTSEGNLKKTLKCDDECARLQRNHQLAAALNIDPATHMDEHVPYSSQTLTSYKDHIQWAQTQERELRIFAADDSQRRLRSKPMPAPYRAFLHSLAEDFGFDHESLDPEPHRHVVLFKTPRFVKAPMKTLADCVRIRAVAAVGPVGSINASSAARLEAPNDPFNGFLLVSPRFALTVEELRSELATAMHTAPILAFDISFLPSEEVVLKAKPSSPTTTITPPSLEAAVKALKSNISSAVASRKLAASVSLCALDSSLNILRKETDKRSGESGWSQVAAKAAGPRLAPKATGWGNKSSFMILGRKKKQEEEKKQEVVDDWEEEMNREEREHEQAASAEDDAITSADASDGLATGMLPTTAIGGSS